MGEAGALEPAGSGETRSIESPDDTRTGSGDGASTQETQSDQALYSSALRRRDVATAKPKPKSEPLPKAKAKLEPYRSPTGPDQRPETREPGPALVDSLTGARLWDSGFVELRRDAQRAARTHQSFVLAFVDVDGLALINASLGRPSGDHVLKLVASTLQANLRSYDLIVRFGSDEFICGIAGVSISEVAERIAGVNQVLASAPEHACVSVGIAQMQDGDTLDSLIARADSELYAQRCNQRRGTQES